MRRQFTMREDGSVYLSHMKPIKYIGLDGMSEHDRNHLLVLKAALCDTHAIDIADFGTASRGRMIFGFGCGGAKDACEPVIFFSIVEPESNDDQDRGNQAGRAACPAQL